MKVKITVMRVAKYADLMEKYENPLDDACNMREGDSFIVMAGEKPADFCQSAWETLHPFVQVLAQGGGNFFDGWMKNPASAMLSCNDGFRPVSFLLEAVSE